MKANFMQYVSRWIEPFTYALFAIFVFSSTITLVAVVDLNQISFWAILLKVLRYAIYVAFLLVIAYKVQGNIYTKEAKIFIGALLVVTAVSMFTSHEKVIFIESLLFGAIYKCDTKKLLKISCSVQGIILIVVVALASFNIIPNMVLDYERMRYNLGFSWTSYASNLLLFVVLQYIVLREDKIEIKELLLLEMANIYLFVKTNTKMSILMLTAVLIVMGFYKEIHTWMQKVFTVIAGFKQWAMLPIVCLMISIFLPLYSNNTSLWRAMNLGLSGRLEFSKNAIINYGFKIFGQLVLFQGYSVLGTEGNEYNYVDSSYLQTLIRYGVLTTILLVCVYIVALKKTRKKNIILFFALVLVVVFCTEEPFLFAATFNVLPVVAFCDEDCFSDEKILKKAAESIDQIKTMLKENAPKIR